MQSYAEWCQSRKGRTLHRNGIPDSRTAEAWDLWKAMEWTSQLHLPNVNCVVDCKVVTHGTTQECRGLLDCIISKCKASLSQLPNSLVSFTKWQANHVIHSLARASQFYASCHTFDHVPSFICFH